MDHGFFFWNVLLPLPQRGVPCFSYYKGGRLRAAGSFTKSITCTGPSCSFVEFPGPLVRPHPSGHIGPHASWPFVSGFLCCAGLPSPLCLAGSCSSFAMGFRHYLPLAAVPGPSSWSHLVRCPSSCPQCFYSALTFVTFIISSLLSPPRFTLSFVLYFPVFSTVPGVLIYQKTEIKSGLIQKFYRSTVRFNLPWSSKQND